ncbi:hypothetical protein CYLTODRAFT_449592 [Cylindrobasidium torrendii FP15055 ss-10]|uniref:Uncharacterized protein n=1 Tax=Cylindrobasidium torrendii FP15055 ss-10 TaxID=1314674 RepID=A0A0D7BRJ8_9AGAR|nr:hypothetical protein CYLTODRAFT_449592 [Cylindrobasidium torrendii FP15055 ss-10]
MSLLRSVGCRTLPIAVRAYASAASATAHNPNVAPASSPPKRRKRVPKVAPAVDEHNGIVTLLEKSGVKQHLAGVRKSRRVVTVEEVETFRPKVAPNPARDDFQTKYRAVQDKITFAFRPKQLARFIRLYGLKVPAQEDRYAYAAVIMEQAWGFASVADIVEARRDSTETETISIQLTPQECFLLMGKDGMDLHGLTSKHRVKIALASNPLALKAEALRGSLRAFEQHVTAFKNNIREDIYDLPINTTVSPSLLQKASRMCGAFIETLSDGRLRISHRADQPESARRASRVITQVSAQDGRQLFNNLTAYIQTPSELDIEPRYAMYPFLASHGTPWALSTDCAFRLRRVGEYSSSQRKEPTGAFLDQGETLSLSTGTCNIQSIMESLGAFTKGNTVSASIGHSVFTTSGPRNRLVPPYQSSSSAADIFDWLKRNSIQRAFLASVPTPVLDRASEVCRVLHRVCYRAIGDMPNAVVDGVRPWKQIHFDVNLHGFGAEDPDSVGALEPQCSAGVSSSLVMLLPDRPVDLQLSVNNMSPLPESDLPEALVGYVGDLESFLRDESTAISQPQPPLSFDYNGDRYILASNTSVRQHKNTANREDIHLDLRIESVLDLESNQKSGSCTISCVNATSPASWQGFVQTCDELTRPATQQTSAQSTLL